MRAGCSSMPPDRGRPSAQRVERLELGARGPGCDPLGEELPGDRAEGDAPHTVSSGDEHPPGAGCSDERKAVGRAWPGTDPLVAAMVEVDAVEEWAERVDDDA